MKLKKIVARLVIIVGMVSLLGGCGMSKETLTKEQQDNVVRWIARGYDVESVEFTKFSKNLSTGNYLLSIKINNDDKLGTIFFTGNIDKFNSPEGNISLDPIEDFQQLKKETIISPDEEINIKYISIIYLER